MGERARGFLVDKFEGPALLEDRNGFVLSLIPYEETTTYKKGTRMGPEAIIDASGHIELMDETLRIDASRHGIVTLRPRVTDLASITRHVAGTAAAHPGALLGFLGGEHSVTPAIIEGLAGPDLGIVWIDAHADLRKSYCGREDNHACAGYNSLPFGRIVQIGIRSLAEEEATLLDHTDRVRVFRRWSERARQAIADLPEAVYLTIDLDGLDPMLMRAVGTPEPGGLLWQEVLEIIDVVTAGKRVRGFDVVELCPSDGDIVSSFAAARLVYKVMAYHAYHNLTGDKR